MDNFFFMSDIGNLLVLHIVFVLAVFTRLIAEPGQCKCNCHCCKTCNDAPDQAAEALGSRIHEGHEAGNTHADGIHRRIREDKNQAADQTAGHAVSEPFLHWQRHAIDRRFNDAEAGTQECRKCNVLHLGALGAEEYCQAGGHVREARRENRRNDQRASACCEFHNAEGNQRPVQTEDDERLVDQRDDRKCQDLRLLNQEVERCLQTILQNHGYRTDQKNADDSCNKNCQERNHELTGNCRQMVLEPFLNL